MAQAFVKWVGAPSCFSMSSGMESADRVRKTTTTTTTEDNLLQRGGFLYHTIEENDKIFNQISQNLQNRYTQNPGVCFGEGKKRQHLWQAHGPRVVGGWFPGNPKQGSTPMLDCWGYECPAL